MIRLSIDRIGFDPQTSRAVIVLKDEAGRRYLPIEIGPLEAHAISMAIEKITPPRPMTHDLIKNLLEQLGYRISRVLIDDLRNQTFFAQITLEVQQKNGQAETLEIDSRPSDAVALAIRADAPIFALEKVLVAAAITDEGEGGDGRAEDQESEPLD